MASLLDPESDFDSCFELVLSEAVFEDLLLVVDPENGETSVAGFVDSFRVRWPPLSSDVDLEREADLTFSNPAFRTELEVEGEVVGFFRVSFKLVEVGELEHLQQHNLTIYCTKKLAIFYKKNGLTFWYSLRN